MLNEGKQEIESYDMNILIFKLQIGNKCPKEATIQLQKLQSKFKGNVNTLLEGQIWQRSTKMEFPCQILCPFAPIIRRHATLFYKNDLIYVKFDLHVGYGSFETTLISKNRKTS